jgi:alkyl hydroperoxide reductase subunit F
MLDEDLKSQLKSYLERITQPIQLVANLDDSATSQQMWELLSVIADQSAQVEAVRQSVTTQRCPSFRIQRVDSDVGVTFAAIPLGHEFTSLVLALLQVGGYPPKLTPELVEQIQSLEGNFHFETYMSLSCHNCPDVVQALNAMSVINPRIQHVAIDGGLFQNEVDQRQIMAVPTIYLNGAHFDQGRTSVEELLAKIDKNAAQRDAAKLHSKTPFDVLIVGGGPAGSAAAVYAARKGIKTGVVSERFGGQVLDTLGIENFISVLTTQGPQFAIALEQHVREYEVDIMNVQKAQRLIPPAQPGGLIEVVLDNGATLKGRSVIISTGARWRQVNVPGEAQYRNHGVAYCPHCDGPLFKGKRVSVIGGGNSGVEAAIDLAGLVAHVTLLEYGEFLRADAVLVKKLQSLSNVDILTNAQTTEIHGDGQKVTGLSYLNRVSEQTHRIELEGVFVQIGLVPNSEWVKDTVALSKTGEVIVDVKGQTNIPGVFAAGDVTTTPYKQIIIATGEGAKAALGAFDHLIRSS